MQELLITLDLNLGLKRQILLPNKKIRTLPTLNEEGFLMVEWVESEQEGEALFQSLKLWIGEKELPRILKNIKEEYRSLFFINEDSFPLLEIFYRKHLKMLFPYDQEELIKEHFLENLVEMLLLSGE